MTKNTSTHKQPHPAPPTRTMFEKFIELAKTSQFAWFAGHVVILIASSILYLTSSQIAYRIAFVGVLHAFGMITYQQHFKNKPNRDFRALLNDENFLYFVMAVVWIFTPVFKLSLITYAIFSVFHVLRYSQTTLLPIVFNITKDNNKYIKSVANFTQTYNEKCMHWVATTELVVLITLLFRALLWYRRSWVILVVYSFFMKCRYENSKYLKVTFAQWRVRLDGIISHPSIPPVVKRAYNQLKLNLIRLSKYQVSKANLSAPSPAASASAAASSTSGSTFNHSKPL